ncbi:M23 family metallopeptidase [Streptomyces sp. NBC_01186]|uniref:M23 family metallopeptidase n=1 Tax=Streptomyces sp. NBC_01186 TaxID=2903765 RepID=UPI002E12E673|nr:M23 family metallopeptidase [Streptomyces sp. NBC_01186]
MVNDRHPSGVPSPDDPGSGFSYSAYDAEYGQAAYGTYGAEVYASGSYEGYPAGSTASYGDEDPLFGTLPGADTGSYATTTWDGSQDFYAPYESYDSYDAYATGSYGYQPATPYIPAQQGPEQADYAYPSADDGTGQWTFGVQDTGTGTWNTEGWGAAYEHDEQAAHNAAYGAYDQTGLAGQTGQPDPYEQAGQYEQASHYEQAGAYEAHEQSRPYEAYETYEQPGQPGHPEQPGQFEQQGQYEQFGPDGAAYHYGQDATGQWSFTQQHEYDTADTWGFPDTGAHDSPGTPEPHDATTAMEALHEDPAAHHEGSGSDDESEHSYEYEPDAAPLAAVAPHSRGRRRSPKPRRRALMTVAVPSVAVMGVAGAAAASVMGEDDGDKGSPAPVAAPDTGSGPVKPTAANRKLDTQLAGLSADADDFADRASRTQERLDLKKRQDAERERKAKEAARKEAMRPKYVLPVKDHTLSAHYGQAGVNWMSVHTGIDFPVSYGTPVMAATDGTVSTKHDMSYGNMAVVTAKDGTETWYCHLSSNKIRSGHVKAGDTIAYSGNSGNSTGPHLHFEVHPGGGSAVDPIPWLQGKGLKIS